METLCAFQTFLPTLLFFEREMNWNLWYLIVTLSDVFSRRRRTQKTKVERETIRSFNYHTDFPSFPITNSFLSRSNFLSQFLLPFNVLNFIFFILFYHFLPRFSAANYVAQNYGFIIFNFGWRLRVYETTPLSQISIRKFQISPILLLSAPKTNFVFKALHTRAMSTVVGSEWESHENSNFICAFWQSYAHIFFY